MFPIIHFRKPILLCLGAFFFLILIAPKFLCPQEVNSQIQYEIWVTLDDANKMLIGKEDLRWTNTTQDEIPDMRFHLYTNAFKNEKSTMFQESQEEDMLGLGIKEGEWGWIDVTSIRLNDGRDLMPTAEFIREDVPIHADDQTVMRIVFPDPIRPGEEVRLFIDFLSKIPRGILRSGYYQNSYFIAQWFPKPGVYEEGRGWNCHEYHLNSEFYADFAAFTVHMTVPGNFVVGASGKQVKAASDPAQKTVTYTFYEQNIHDFAWTASPDFIKVERDFVAAEEISREEYEKIAERLGLSLEDVELPDVRMILLIEPEHRGQIERHFKALRMAIKYYGLWYGPYPYETVTMVDPPFRTGSGGMEYPTFFTAGTRILRSKKVLSPEHVIIHEFGHSYWYGLCANNEFEEAWLDEGINTYSTGKVSAAAYGPGALAFSLNRIPLNWFFRLPEYLDFEYDRATGIHVVKLDPIATYSWLFAGGASYGLNVYQRASACLHSLERLLGEVVMLRILRTFLIRFRYQHPKTEDFIAIVNEISGRNMSWFFEELFFKTLNFDYGISSLKSGKKKETFLGIFDSDGRKEEVTQTHIDQAKKEKARSKEDALYVTNIRVRRYGEAKVSADFPLKLKVVFEDGSEEIRFWEGQKRWEKFVFEKPVKAKYAYIDPEGIWLIDSNLANNSMTLKPNRSGILRITGKFLFWIQNSLLFLGALT